jgi:sulfite exporter TauE/SafE
MNVDTLSFTAAFLIGLLGGAHCIGMCGGITGTFGLNSKGTFADRFTKNLAFNTGRIISYSCIGFIIGLASALLAGLSPTVGMILRLIAGVFIILMGLYIADWSRAITKIEKPGQWIWKHIQPLTKPFLPADTLIKSLCLGGLWGWLPCGLVYSTLVLASANASPINAAGVMLAFGLGTLPTMLATGLLASQLSNIIRNKRVRNFSAVLMIGMGIWIVYGNSQHLIGHGEHGSHHGDHSQSMDHSTMDHSTMDHSQMNHNENNQNTVDHSTMDHSTMDHSQMNHNENNQNTVDHSTMDHSKMDHSKMNH